MDGLNATELVSNLLEVWCSSGPTVAVLEGFSGTGKTAVARKVQKAWLGPTVFVTAPDQGANLEDLLFEIAAKLEAGGNKTVADAANGDFRKGLKEFLRSPALVIIDDFDELLDPASRAVDPEIADFLRDLSRSHEAGRLLIVTNQTPADASWLSESKIVTLAPPAKLEAEGILLAMLKDRGLENEVPREMMGDVVAWLGRNPRAMQAFVGCLRDEPLDDLIGIDDETWQLRDQTRSRKLLGRLEKAFLRKTIDRLEPESLLVLEGLSVYRKPFLNEAIAAVAPSGVAAPRARDELTSRFLLSHTGKLYSLNPVARQLCQARLSGDRRRLRLSHSKAADHFQKRVAHTGAHSGARSIYRSGSDFVEARFHLFSSGREAEFENIAGDFRRLLLQNYQYVKSVPSEAVQLGQLLELLKFALHDGDKGYSRLRRLLVDLFLERNRVGDNVQAYHQINLVCRESHDPGSWLLRIRLTSELESPQALRAVGGQALETLSHPNAATVCAQCAEALSLQGQNKLALSLLEDALRVVGPEHRVILYSHLGFVLAKGGQRREAARRLLDGFKEVRSLAKYAARLFEQAVFMSFQQRDMAGIRAAQLNISRELEPDKYYLCEILALQLEGAYAAAAKLGSEHTYSYVAIAAQTAFCWLSVGDVKRAVEAARRLDRTSVSSWLRALIAICQEAGEIYIAMMAQYMGRELAEAELGDNFLWLRIWSDIPEGMGPYPAFYFPVLPACLTQLDHEIHHSSGSPISIDFADLNSLRLPMIESRHNREILQESSASPRSFIAEEQPGRLTINVNYNEGIRTMASKNEFNGPVTAGVIGDGAKLYSPSFHQNSSPQIELSAELINELQKIVASAGSQPAAIREVEQVQMALDSAASGDAESVRSHLRAAGRWALDKATDLGTEIAKEAIIRSMGPF
ncbi:AAA family ATPase [Paenarthrobacter sp. NEAU-H11]|uniref:AAA family ATPase n=1 Tax=Paenarthrobacter sp. NEAU-H11 TaxID=3423924 RepID=UPI003D3552DB